MGRHSSPEQWPFYRSVAAWLLPWAMIAAVVGVAVWVAVATVGGQDPGSPALSSGRQTPKEKPSSAAPVVVKTKTPPPPEKEPEPSDTPEVLPKLITNGVTVQVLNASGSPGVDRTMADKLRGLGFQIAAVVQASKLYDQTTVFWSSNQSRPAAEALAQHFGWPAEPKPANLSADVSVHVVVGEDEA
jgi:hypothetical protein